MLKRVAIGICVTHFVYKLWKYLKSTQSNDENEDAIEDEDSCSGEDTTEDETESHTAPQTFPHSSEASDVNSNLTEYKNFSQYNLKLTGHFSSIPINKEDKYKKLKFSLLHPHDVAYLPSLKQFLVTETYYDRVGVYDKNFAFQHWLPYPKKHQRFQMPTSILSLQNGFILLLEKKGIQIFDAHLNWVQFKTGHYSGLTESLNGDIYTMAWFKEDVSRCHVRKLSSTDGKYYWDGSIKLTVISEDLQCQCQESNSRFLAHHKDTIFITDTGLNRFYTVNVVTGEQIVHRGYRNIPSQVAKPTGVITDDKGNILIVDRDNKRLVVYSETGEFIRVMDVANFEFPSNLQTIRKINNNYYSCDRGNKGQNGGIYKFSLTSV